MERAGTHEATRMGAFRSGSALIAGTAVEGCIFGEALVNRDQVTATSGETGSAEV
jgi:hypothetical protein